MTTVLAIDQSLTCTAYVLKEKLPNSKYRIHEYGLIKTTLNRSVNRINSTLLRIRSIVSQLRPYADRADEVWIESISYSSNGNATRDLAMLFYALHSAFNAKWVAPTTIKKFATGKGNTKGKEALFNALPVAAQRVFDAYPKTGGKYDLTDAFWIAKYALANR